MMQSAHRLKVIMIVISVLANCFYGVFAYAATKDQAVSLAKDIMHVTIKTQNRTHSFPRNVTDDVMDIILGRRADDLSSFLIGLEDKQKILNLDLILGYSELTQSTLGELTKKTDYQFLLETSKTMNWKRSHLSNLLLGQLHLGNKDILKALEYTGQAIEIVNKQPVTLETTSMIYDAYGVLQSAYIYDRSTDQAVEAMSMLKDLSMKAGRPLDGFSLVNNLAVLFSTDGRHTDAIEIMQVMEPFLKGQAVDKVLLYNFSIAKFKNRASLYSEALPHLEKIEKIGLNTWLMPYIYNELARSYAYSGEINKSEATMEQIDKLSSEERPKSELFELSIMNVKSQIAEKQGRYKMALELKNEYSQRSIDRTNAAQFQDRKKAADRIAISQRVATQKLENAARESALKDTIIDREKNISRISLGLLGLAAILLCSLIYGVKQQKSMNIKLAASRDKALASERAKSDFLAMMSHEVRTPLNSIIPVAELLQAKAEYHEDRGLLSLIVAGGNTLLQMLDNVLVVSKADNSPPEYAEDLNLVDVVKPILKEFGDEAHRKGLAFSAKATKGFPLSVHTDKNVISKILSNLLSNAVKFTSQGEISVTFSLAADEDYVSIKIQDTGIGMQGENLEELLEPFTQKDSGITRGYDGLGIGLCVTNIEVARLGGRLDFHTDLEVGTAVEVLLPIKAPLQEPIHLEMAA